MRVKYNRVSTLNQSGDRFTADKESYDLVLFDKISGTVPFRDRPQAKELVKLIEGDKVAEVHIEELSRIGRNVGDCISCCEWMDSKGINIVVKNLGLQSRPNGERNPVWKMITAVLSSMYSMELENIKERTSVGRQVYLQKGGVLGKPKGSCETESNFLKKEACVNVLKSLKKGLTVREVAKVVNVSTRTVMKLNKLASKHNLLKL